MTNILRIDASMRHDGSVTRRLTDAVIDRLSQLGPSHVTTRDLAEGIEIIDQDWIEANFTADKDRSDAQVRRLAFSDTLVDELEGAEVIVIGLPIYNFGIPAALKAWVDLVARARVTFRYTENGPIGLLQGKKVIIVAASGGTGVDTQIDFATPYLRHALAFLGITAVEVIAADRLMTDADATLARVSSEIERLAA